MSEIDFNGLLLGAEHEIGYSAKRAIEMYIPVWEKGPASCLFHKCAEHYHLSKEQIRQCELMMSAWGMKDALVGMNCPRCGKAMERKADRGEVNGPNGGWLCVMEECAKVTEMYDDAISMWKCLGCEQVVYLSEET